MLGILMMHEDINHINDVLKNKSILDIRVLLKGPQIFWHVCRVFFLKFRRPVTMKEQMDRLLPSPENLFFPELAYAEQSRLFRGAGKNTSGTTSSGANCSLESLIHILVK